MNDRAAAALALYSVIRYQRTTDQVINSLETATARDYLFGALRHYFALVSLLEPLVKKSLPKRNGKLWCLMIIGAYQLLYSRAPEYAAINETVAACDKLEQSWAKGLVNGVLRNVQRLERAAIPVLENFPKWFVKIIKEDYGSQADAILEAFMGRSPMTLRVNQQRTTVKEYTQLLTSAGIDHSLKKNFPAIILRKPIPQSELPEFKEGRVSVQDFGACLVTHLLDLKPGQSFLDACSAPGGKLFALIESTPEIHATALEVSPSRFTHLQAESERLGHTPTMIKADATNLDWWDGKFFDAILVDAPCSGSGTIRRHPEIKLRHGPTSLIGFHEKQLQLLKSSWQTLALGGRLLYCTCSVFSFENDGVIKAFLEAEGNASSTQISLPTGQATKLGWQLLPTNGETDGFYYALLERGA